jgi:hypothetical protein
VIKRRCPLCGYSFAPAIAPEARAHARYHRDFELGPRLTAGGWRWRISPLDAPEDEVVRVLAGEPLRLRRRVHHLALLAMAAAGFDRPPWPPPSPADRRDPETPRAYLYLRAGRAVGLAIFRHRHVTRRAAIAGPAWTPPHGGAPRWVLDLAWTAPAAQRAGTAARLVALALADLELGGSEIAYLKPFTPAGARLARRLAGVEEIWLG